MVRKRGGGVCISADSAVGEADALMNIGAEHAQRFPPVSASAAAAALAGGHAEVEGVRARFWASVRHVLCNWFFPVFFLHFLNFSEKVFVL